MGHEWHSSRHHGCGALEIVPSQQSQGPGAPAPPQAPLSPWSPERCLAFHTPSLNKAFAVRSRRSLSLYLYSEALASPSQCCFKSCYCCFSIDRELRLLSPTCSVHFMRRSAAQWGRGLLLFMSPWKMKINGAITEAK